MKKQSDQPGAGSNIAKRLASYSAAAAATAASTQDPANAAEIVHDIADVTAGDTPGILFNLITGSTAPAPAWTGNTGDGLFRMASWDSFPYIAGPAGSTMAGFVGPGGFGPADVYPDRLSISDTVGPLKNFGANTEYLQYGPYAYLSRNFTTTTGFVGLRFKIGGSLHYGWAQVTHLGAGQGTILHGFGYQDVSGEASKPVDTVGTPQAPAARITSIEAVGGGTWELTLEGEADTGYEFISSPILGFDPGTLVEGLSQGDPGDEGTIGGTNDSILTTDPKGFARVRMALAGPTNFVRAQIPPPVEVFSESFDDSTGPGLPAGWTSGKNTADNSSLTNWEPGTPANVGPVPPGVPLPSGDNCVATNISGNYDDPASDLGVAHTDIWLRSPSIDLGAATAGTLSFQQWTEIEQVPGDLDYGSIRILDASDDSELAVMEAQSIDGSTSGWEEYSMELPAEAFTATAGTIKVEWQFEADDIDSFAGWYIDNVRVTTPRS